MLNIVLANRPRLLFKNVYYCKWMAFLLRLTMTYHITSGWLAVGFRNLNFVKGQPWPRGLWDDGVHRHPALTYSLGEREHECTRGQQACLFAKPREKVSFLVSLWVDWLGKGLGNSKSCRRTRMRRDCGNEKALLQDVVKLTPYCHRSLN